VNASEKKSLRRLLHGVFFLMPCKGIVTDMSSLRRSASGGRANFGEGSIPRIELNVSQESNPNNFKSPVDQLTEQAWRERMGKVEAPSTPHEKAVYGLIKSHLSGKQSLNLRRASPKVLKGILLRKRLKKELGEQRGLKPMV